MLCDDIIELVGAEVKKIQDNKIFHRGKYHKLNNWIGNYILDIKYRTKKDKLSFTIDYHGVHSWYNNRFIRQIYKDSNGDEYIKFILLDKEKNEDLNSGDGFRLEAQEVNNNIYIPTLDSDDDE